MFYKINKLSTYLFVKPEDMHEIGDKSESYIQQKVSEKVLGSCYKTIGYIVYVLKIADREEGETNAEILEDGRIKILVNFECIAFLPYKNQILDVIVQTAQQQKIIARVGPCEVRINQQGIPQTWQFKEDQKYEINENNQSLSVTAGTKIRVKVTDVTISNTLIINATLGIPGTGLIDQDQEE